MLRRANIRQRRKGRSRKRAQAEVIGGLIVLTLLFLFAVPMLLNTYFTTQKTIEEYGAKQTRRLANFNERLSIQPVNPNNVIAQNLGWIPGIFINNTGTTDVTLDKLYLINIANKTIYAVFDFRYLRPAVNPLVKLVLMNVVYINGSLSWEQPPPLGQPVTLKPGENILIVFDESLRNIAPYIIVRVESSTGVLHPIVGGPYESRLYPEAAFQAGGGQALEWRGIFYPQSGFQLRGASDLLVYGDVYAWVPPLYVYPDIDSDRNYEPTSMYYYESFIYDDPKFPGLYYIKVKVLGIPAGWWGYLPVYLRITKVDQGYPSSIVPVYPEWTIELRGFLGTYDTGSEGTYFNGYAFKVIIRDSQGNIVYSFPEAWGYTSLKPLILGQSGVTQLDFDGNGVNELVFYSYLNGPTIINRVDINVDSLASTYPAPNDEVRDSVAWTYVVARDISGIDYIKVTAKINYYWTTTFSSCPASFRTLKIFTIAILKYDNTTGKWIVYQYQNYGYSNEKPKQFQPTVTFPVDRSGTYRVAIIFYDNYRDWDYGYGCWTDFTYSLEHLIVEYGITNPYFKESPPVYLVAIPDPTIINGIGEYDYMNLKGLNDVNEAKVLAQQDLLEAIVAELNYVGITGYTIIDNVTMLYEIFFDNPAPPKYAIVFWLQGAVSITDVLGTYGVTDAQFASYTSTYHWLWVWISGEPFGGIEKTLIYFSNYVVINGPGLYNLNITSNGLTARNEFYAFYLTDQATFNYTSTTTVSACIVQGSDFYWNSTASPPEYGTVAYWIGCQQGGGAFLINPVHIDWDRSGVGVMPETAVQQVVYSALYAWNTIRFG